MITSLLEMSSQTCQKSNYGITFYIFYTFVAKEKKNVFKKQKSPEKQQNLYGKKKEENLIHKQRHYRIHEARNLSQPRFPTPKISQNSISPWEKRKSFKKRNISKSSEKKWEIVKKKNNNNNK